MRRKIDEFKLFLKTGKLQAIAKWTTISFAVFILAVYWIGRNYEAEEEIYVDPISADSLLETTDGVGILPNFKLTKAVSFPASVRAGAYLVSFRHEESEHTYTHCILIKNTEGERARSQRSTGFFDCNNRVTNLNFENVEVKPVAYGNFFEGIGSGFYELVVPKDVLSESNPHDIHCLVAIGLVQSMEIFDGYGGMSCDFPPAPTLDSIIENR